MGASIASRYSFKPASFCLKLAWTSFASGWPAKVFVWHRMRCEIGISSGNLVTVQACLSDPRDEISHVFLRNDEIQVSRFHLCADHEHMHSCPTWTAWVSDCRQWPGCRCSEARPLPAVFWQWLVAHWSWRTFRPFPIALLPQRNCPGLTQSGRSTGRR